MATVEADNTFFEVLSRVLDMADEQLTPAAAEYLLTLRPSEADRARANALSERARQGTLTSDERRELDGYVRCGQLIETWQLKARLALQRSTRCNG